MDKTSPYHFLPGRHLGPLAGYTGGQDVAYISDRAGWDYDIPALQGKKSRPPLTLKKEG